MTKVEMDTGEADQDLNYPHQRNLRTPKLRLII